MGLEDNLKDNPKASSDDPYPSTNRATEAGCASACAPTWAGPSAAARPPCPCPPAARTNAGRGEYFDFGYRHTSSFRAEFVFEKTIGNAITRGSRRRVRNLTHGVAGVSVMTVKDEVYC